MKKHTIAYLIAAIVCTTMFSSYSSGPASHGRDCTGAETGLQNPTGCNITGGCHSSSATTGISIAIELDSAGIATTHYVGGMTYTVKLTGTNNTSSTLPKFGFQMGSIQGSTAVTTPVNAGTWVAPFPAGTHFATPVSGSFVVNIVEQSLAQLPISGSGGNGTIYSKTFNWKAPVSGTGTVSIWAALNAVNGNGNNDTGDLWNTNHIAINEWGTSSTGISSVETDNFSINVFPNPVLTNLNLEYTLNQTGNVSIKLFDLQGRQVAYLLNETQNSGFKTMNISLPPELSKGIYILKVSSGDAQYLKKIIVSR